MEWARVTSGPDSSLLACGPETPPFRGYPEQQGARPELRGGSARVPRGSATQSETDLCCCQPLRSGAFVTVTSQKAVELAQIPPAKGSVNVPENSLLE